MKKALCWFMITVALGHGQDPNVDRSPRRGVYPSGTFAPGEIDTVDVATGNVSIRLPLASLPPGPTAFGAGFQLVYNSNFHDLSFNCDGSTCSQILLGSSGGAGATLGWKYGYDYGLELENRGTWLCTGSEEPHKNKKMLLRMPDGSKKLLRPKGYTDHLGTGYYNLHPSGFAQCAGDPNVAGNAIEYYTVDGSFLRVSLNTAVNSNWWQQIWTIYFPDGSRALGYSGNTSLLLDRHGNPVSVYQHVCPSNDPDCTAGTDTITTLQDQFGRSVDLIQRAGGVDMVRGKAVTNTSVKWFITWAYQTGSQKQYTSDSSGGITSYTPQGVYVSSVQTPPAESGGTGQTYSFTTSLASGGFGELRTATLPTGATVTFSHEWDGITHVGSFPLDLKNTLVQKSVAFPAAYDGVTENVQEIWQYDVSRTTANQTTITAPDGGVWQHFYFEDLPSNTKRGLVYKTVNPDGSAVERLWHNNKVHDGYADSNPYVAGEFQTAANAGGAPALKSATKYSYDKNGNLREQVEYDYLAYTEGTSFPADTAQRRVTTMTYHHATATAGNGTEAVTDEATAYWNASSPLYKQAVKRREVKRSATQPVEAASQFDYDSSSTTGRVTVERHWSSKRQDVAQSNLDPLTDAVSATTRYTYNSRGSVRTVTRDNFTPHPATVTQIDYDTSDLYPIRRIEAQNAPVVSLTTNLVHDFWTGALLTASFANGGSKGTQYDLLGRPKQITEAISTSPVESRVTTIVYNDVLRCVITSRQIDASRSQNRVEHFDAWNRLRLVRELEGGAASCSDETAGIKTEYRYKLTGGFQYELRSNPFRAARVGLANSEETSGWRLVIRDAAGRVRWEDTYGVSVSANPPTGSLAPFPWGTKVGQTDYYNTNPTGRITTNYDVAGTRQKTTVIDASGNTRSMHVDGLGRLMQVDEVDNGQNPAATYATTYDYDARDNLTSVIQGSQARMFIYDSLGMLRSATNPETGLVEYQYDDKGNMVGKKDGRVTVTMTYNERNQIKTKSYAAKPGVTMPTTAAVNYSYDESFASRGQLTTVSSGGFTAKNTAFDLLGRIKASEQIVDGAAFRFVYGYWRNDQLSSMTYPSGKQVQFDVDNAGRVQHVRNGTQNYATGVSYAAHQGLSGLQQGNGKHESWQYTSRLETAGVKVGTAVGGSDLLGLSYQYTSNGNLQYQTIQPLGVVQSYEYDSIGRVKRFTEGGASQEYRYDRYGNRWVVSSNPQTIPVDQAQTPTAEAFYNGANNRLVGRSYDGAGNLESYSPWVASYDGENRMVSTTSGQNGNATYEYDGLGRRVRRTVNGVVDVFVYDAFGGLALELSSAGAADGGRTYYTVDALGTTRLTTNASGGDVKRYDYLPFGELLSLNGRTVQAEQPRVQFTGQMRDGQTRLDYFGARYFSGGQGRFTSPDVPLLDQDPTDPQSWNLYSYGRNNPLRFVDPTGNYVFDSSASEDEKKRFREQLAAAQAAANALRDKYGEKSNQYTNAARALGGYGAEGVANGVTVAFGAPKTAGAGGEVTLGLSTKKTADNPTGQNIRATFDPSAVSAGLIGHEGQHVADASAWIAGGYASALNTTAYQGEFDATRVQLSISEGQGNIGAFLGSGSSRRLMWFQGWPESNVTNTINGFLAIPRVAGGLYGLTPTSPRRLFTRPMRPRR